MSNFELALWSFPVMLALIFLRVPIALAMGATGFIGTWMVLGRPDATLNQLKSLTYDTFSSYSLSIIPLFLLMGQFATRSGMSGALFRVAADWLGHRKGGVAMATVGACAGFGAVCGSSLATASTMGQVALPEMRKRGFSDSLSTGVLAAGGTLGILIPPSVILVIYAIEAEQNVIKMFAAAMIPGILAALGYMLVVAIYARIRPDAAVTTDRVPYGERFLNMLSILPVIAIFLLVIGGIYLGIFTPTEGAAFGAVATGLYAAFTGGLNRDGLVDCMAQTAKTSAMIFLILLGAQIFNSFLAFTQTPASLADWVTGQGFTPMFVLAIILVIYLIFGCVMDSLSMILLTLPVFLPIIEALDFGL
ncbi:MAG: TRAP transporter large permease, partial [Pseudomonadota bacterium]